MVNILLEGFDISSDWLHPELSKYIHKHQRVAVIPFSFRDSQVKCAKDLANLYGRNGRYYGGIIEGLAAYGISEDSVDFINYFTDSLESAAEKISNADIVYFTGGLPDRMMERIHEFGLYDQLAKHRGVVLGYSAGAMVQIKEFHISPDNDYSDFCYCEGLPYLEGFDIEVHYEDTEIQRASVRRVLVERGGPVYAMSFMRGALIVEDGALRTVGDVKIFNKDDEL